MGSREKPLFDLNEPAVEEEDSGSAICFPPLAVASTVDTSKLFTTSASPNRTVNSNVISHPSSVSGLQPFIRSKGDLASEGGEDPKMETDTSSVIEKEEGEWSDVEGSADANRSRSVPEMSTSGYDDKSQVKKTTKMMNQSDSNMAAVVNSSSNVDDIKNENSNHALLGLDSDSNYRKSSCSRNSEGDIAIYNQEDYTLAPKRRDIKGAEATHALKLATSPGKRSKLDQQKEAMLGKKRSRQTMFLNLEDVKQAGPAKQVGPIKIATPRRQYIPPPTTTGIVKESRPLLDSSERSGEKLSQQTTTKDSKEVDQSCNEGNTYLESSDTKSECDDGDMSSGPITRSKRRNNGKDPATEDRPLSDHRQNSLKQPVDSRQMKHPPVSLKKPPPISQTPVDPKAGVKKLPSRKPSTVTTQYQDTSVERLLREVTNEKFWQHPEEAELKCVPGSFESVEEYVRVFEPLLFEECRAQLYRWYDVILLPASESRWNFKEGDVAVLSTPRPGTVRYKRSNCSTIPEESEVCGRVAGTVRRHIPIDTRDPIGAILHFYVGDSYDSSSKDDDDHILKKLHQKGVWFLTVLGALATTQREYMQTAILQPSPDHFPKYEEMAPTMPECFTTNFVDYLHKTFNGPQLSAIHWAAMHTAAGTTNGLTKRQDPWPFTLVQGPPGTGKTHTVWGMLNVIHLVQYQHYYTALLKKLAPESYKQATESLSSESAPIGSIDEVLQNMDQNLFRTLHKLCPKPRMLVCAPSNAATDELLTRVLDRGFIDGEMKVYRPDVARVGVDTQTRAAQAVSVERRTEQLLMKSRDEVYGWMHQLRGREAQLSQQIASLQRELNVAAFTGRSQGSVGVDPEVLVARDQSRDSLLQNLAAVVENRDKVLVEMSRLFILEGRFRSGGNFNLEEARASLEASFANEAEVVFTTVSSSGRKLFSRLTHGFDMVVIDEAAQASEYRMHPQIRDFPSRYFYQGRLTDSESVAKLADELYYKDPLLRPYVFYDITHGRESHRGGSVSFQNVHEAQFCFRLYEHLRRSIKSLGMPKVSVGIITPYKLQLKCIQREFAEVLSSEDGKDVYINTVDAFQGQERDIIIMSCVRASGHGVGFVADIRRMNARQCYMDMDLLPKEFLAPKVAQPPSYGGLPPPYGGPPPPPPPPPAKFSNSRGGYMRPGFRHRSEDEGYGKTNSTSRNGIYRQPSDEFDRSRNGWQYGGDRRHNSNGVGGRRDHP
ncbi:putative helicase MAGATAMA 3 [Cynara cardunculus var. scolymus]|uniref:Putative helicase MAGATAMA 3 n=1 Tax=Cynara cardunculus var. scolymus TaxID=59895 RepID=A0A118JZ58_CYNCS|nr:putative helicase MAGATAMA 3 [Cynara cardunculus var. scolymus]